MNIRLALCLSLLLFPLPAAAQEGVTPTHPNDDLVGYDSVDAVMDDGIMSPEEMEFEANQIYRMCEINAFQRSVYNCGCLAGAFLIQREKLGPMIPQTEILDTITLEKPTASCADIVAVAGNSYTNCMEQIAPIRSLKNDNEEYCACVANFVANNFAKTPVLHPAQISYLTYDGMISCEDPQKRPKRTAAKTAN